MVAGARRAADRVGARALNRRAWAAGAGVAAAGLALVAGLAALPLPARLAVGGSPVVSWADGTPMNVALAPDDRWRVPVTVDDVDPDFVTALVAREDARFWWHPGVDPLAIVRAAGQDVLAGRIVSGGSTLTMQLARVLEPRPRTVVSKLVEAGRAAQLELALSKREILGAWLTFAPYGGNVEGVEAAALGLFGHPARDLDVVEIATLLAIPQDPAARRPSPRNAPALRAARDAVAARLVADGVWTEADLARVRAAAVPDALQPMPREAPHAAAWLRRGDRTSTTLRREVQTVVDRAVAREREAAAREGIRAVAVVVVEHATGEIVGLTGGYTHDPRVEGSMIAAFDVPRSPGSALKPLIYGLALDRGLALPEWLVEDVPVAYGSWIPRNFDGQFDGVVPLEQALSRSLNLPFVALLQQLGVEPFLGVLRGLGARRLDARPGHYGLSVAAGGIELSPLEMAAIFAAIANDGQPIALRATPGAGAPGPRVMSPGAAWLVKRALSLRDRPDFPARRAAGGVPRGIHWKTGTSYGFRDAWAIGSGPTHTVAVWHGNLDQQGSVNLVGARASGPMLFDLLEALSPRPVDAPTPAELSPIEVCALSGRLPGAACPTTTRVLAKRTRVPTETCALHTRVERDVRTGLRVAPGCRTGPTVVEDRVLWPPAVVRWLPESERGAPLPAWAPGCAPAIEGGGPRVVSPQPGEIRVLVPGIPAEDQEIPLEADGVASDEPVVWFVDGRLVGRGIGGERVWWLPARGEHEVVAQDAAGRSGRLRFEVR